MYGPPINRPGKGLVSAQQRLTEDLLIGAHSGLLQYLIACHPRWEGSNNRALAQAVLTKVLAVYKIGVYLPSTGRRRCVYLLISGNLKIAGNLQVALAVALDELDLGQKLLL